MDMIADKLAQVRARIAAACAGAKRDVRSVTLLAVGKTQPADALRAAFDSGATRFGENYVQEGLAKIDALADLRCAIEWHLIGPLQANKTRSVAEQFDWVHSIDRLRIAQRLSEQRPAQLAPLQVCLQVNIDAQTSKSGVDPVALPELAHAIVTLPGLRLRGLMAIPAPARDLAKQRAPHRELRELFERLRADGLELDTLSMGMSDDLEAAIAEGSTLVRVGSAIFGARG
ncbi:MAG: YggS family pyridoxal phosphate-dependent enzyme [Burkholderiaceae bacterium]